MIKQMILNFITVFSHPSHPPWRTNDVLFSPASGTQSPRATATTLFVVPFRVCVLTSSGLPLTELMPRELVACLSSAWAVIGSGLWLVVQWCLTPCKPVDCSLPGCSIHGILQARILEWVAMPFPGGSSWPTNLTRVSCIAGRLFTSWATREAHGRLWGHPNESAVNWKEANFWVPLWSATNPCREWS